MPAFNQDRSGEPVGVVARPSLAPFSPFVRATGLTIPKNVTANDGGEGLGMRGMSAQLAFDNPFGAAAC